MKRTAILIGLVVVMIALVPGASAIPALDDQPVYHLVLDLIS